MDSPDTSILDGLMGALSNISTPFPEPADQTLTQLFFLTGMYGYVLFNAANILSDGSELLLLVPTLAPVVGSIVLPVLGAVPDGMMVLFSGLGDDAQNQISVGVGALAGSTIMLLTFPVFVAVVTGRVSITPEGKANYKRQPKLDPNHPWSLTKTGVGIDGSIKSAARMMIITLVGYFIIQGACTTAESFEPTHPNGQAKFENKFALVGLVVCIAEFMYYLLVCWRETRSGKGDVEDNIIKVQREAMRQGKLTLRGAMSHFKEKSWPALSTMNNHAEEGDLKEVFLNKDCMDEVRHMCKLLGPFFSEYDVNNDNTLEFEEFRMIFKDLNENLSRDAQHAMFSAADTDGNDTINFEEFVACLMSFALDRNLEEQPGPRRPSNTLVTSEGADDGDDNGEEAEDMPPDLAGLTPAQQQWRIKKRAATKMMFGTFLVLIFSDPMVDLLSEIGKRLDISPFYISFIVAPFASNASELVAAKNYAQKRTLKSQTTALSALVGAAVMNNSFCLGIFLALVYFKQLRWEFSAETFAIVLVELLVALFVMKSKTLSLFNGLIILSFYPISLLVVYVLHDFGLD